MLITVISLFACAAHALMLHSQYNLYFYTSILKVCFVLCPIFYFLLAKEKNIVAQFFSKGEKMRPTFFLAAGTFAAVVVGFFILRPFFDEDMIIGAFATFGITEKNFAFVFAYVIFINAAVEEIFFRGFVFLNLWRKGHKIYSHIYSSLLFAIYHVTILSNAVSTGIFILFVAGLAASGLFFNFLAQKNKNIVGSLIVHISANIAINCILLSILLGK